MRVDDVEVERRLARVVRVLRGDHGKQALCKSGNAGRGIRGIEVEATSAGLVEDFEGDIAAVVREEVVVGQGVQPGAGGASWSC